jgi:amino acid permease
MQRKIGSISFALGCAAACFHAYGAMHNCNIGTWIKVSLASVMAGATMCVVTGLAGYSSFRSATKAEILDNFDEDDAAANVFRLLLVRHRVASGALLSSTASDRAPF